MEEKLKCLYVETKKIPKEIEIDDDIETLQSLVKGYIECVYLPKDEDVILVCNDSGKINNMELNRDIGYDIIAGPFLIVGNDKENGEFKSLTDDQLLKYKNIFGEGSIEQTENKISTILLNQLTNNFNRKEKER